MGNTLHGYAAKSERWLRDQIARHRWELIWAGVGTLASALFRPYANLLGHRVMLDPWFGLYIIFGLCLTAFVLWSIIGNKGGDTLGGLTMLFWLTYCLIFCSADVAGLLEWRTPRGFEGVAAPTRWSGVLPVRWGDWRYFVVGRPAVVDPRRIVVVLRSDGSGATKEKLRFWDARLIRVASRGGATAIGVDATYAGTSSVDSMFCDLVQGARPPLITAYEMRRDLQLGVFVREPGLDAQPECLRPDNQGQAMSLVDADKRIRGIPLYWEDWSRDSQYPAFSLKVAMEGGAKSPAQGDRFLRILRPPHISIDVRDHPADIPAMAQHRDFFGGKIVIIGSTSPSDRFLTPFGAFPGAEIHAFAVFDLLHGYYFTQCPAPLSAIIIFGGCFTILLLWWRQATMRSMLFAAAVISVSICLLSALLARYFLLWVNVIFAVAAVWLLLPLLQLRSRWGSFRGHGS